MVNEQNGNLVIKGVMTALFGAFIALMVTRLIGFFFQQEMALVDFILIAVGCSLMAILVIKATQRQKNREQRDVIDSAEATFDKVITAVVIGLLLFTSMISGPYLIVVPIISVALIIVYIVVNMRKR